MMSSLAFLLTDPMRESGNHFQRFGVMNWETQFALWHSVFMLWWISLMLLIQKSPEAHVDYWCAGQCFFLGLTVDDLKCFASSVGYHAVFVLCLLTGDLRSVSVSTIHLDSIAVVTVQI